MGYDTKRIFPGSIVYNSPIDKGKGKKAIYKGLFNRNDSTHHLTISKFLSKISPSSDTRVK